MFIFLTDGYDGVAEFCTILRSQRDRLTKIIDFIYSLPNETEHVYAAVLSPAPGGILPVVYVLLNVVITNPNSTGGSWQRANDLRRCFAELGLDPIVLNDPATEDEARLDGDRAYIVRELPVRLGLENKWLDRLYRILT